MRAFSEDAVIIVPIDETSNYMAAETSESPTAAPIAVALTSGLITWVSFVGMREPF